MMQPPVVRERGRMPSAMTLSAATAAAVARSLNAEAGRPNGGLRERLVEAKAAAADPMLQRRRRRETFSSLAMEIDDGNGTTSLSSGSSFVPGAAAGDEDRSEDGGSEMAEVHNNGWGRQIQRQFLY